MESVLRLYWIADITYFKFKGSLFKFGYHHAALKEAEEAIKGEDKEAIEAKTQALAQAAQKLGEEMQKAQQAAPGGEAKAEAGKKDDGNVVDAEFEEVKDGKK